MCSHNACISDPLLTASKVHCQVFHENIHSVKFSRLSLNKNAFPTNREYRNRCFMNRGVHG